jgi:hypothetical protein
MLEVSCSIRKCGCISRKLQDVDGGDILKTKRLCQASEKIFLCSTVQLLYCVLKISDGSSSPDSNLCCYVIIGKLMTVLSVYDGN